MNDFPFELSWQGPLPVDMGSHIGDQLPTDYDLAATVHNIFSRYDPDSTLHIRDIPRCCMDDMTSSRGNHFTNIGCGVFDYGIHPFLLTIYKHDVVNGAPLGDRCTVYSLNISDADVDWNHSVAYDAIMRKVRYFRERKYHGARSYGINANEDQRKKSNRKPNYLPRFHPYY